MLDLKYMGPTKNKHVINFINIREIEYLHAKLDTTLLNCKDMCETSKGFCNHKTYAL